MSLAFPSNKVAVITGASSGIGRAAALLYAKQGTHLVLIARRAEKLDELKKEIAAASADVKVHSISMDVNDRAAVDGLLAKIPSELQAVDILINNAGGARDVAKVGDIDLQDMDYMLDVNVKAVVHLTQVFVKLFKQNKKGHVVQIGSIAGRESYPTGSVYCASKAALRAFTNALMRELYDTPIRVSEIQPGLVNTEFSTARFKGDKDKADKLYVGLDPLVAHDIAEEILWITSRPAHVNIAELFILPVNQAAPQLVYKTSQ